MTTKNTNTNTENAKNDDSKNAFSNSFGVSPFEMMKNMWGQIGNNFNAVPNMNLSGMPVPTLNTEELDKQIKDMRAVEGWLRMNLSMLQMTIQNLEMQKTSLTAVQTMSKFTANVIKSADQRNKEVAEQGDTPPMLFPWQFMQQMTEQFHQNATNIANVAKENAAAAMKVSTETTNAVKAATESIVTKTKSHKKKGE